MGTHEEIVHFDQDGVLDISEQCGAMAYGSL